MAYMRDSTGRRLDSFEAISADEVGEAVAGLTATKLAAQVIGSNGSGSDFTGTEILIRLPWTPTVTTKRWRLRQHNKKPSGSGAAGTITSTGLYVGEPAYDATGGVSGATASAPAQYLPGWSFDSAAGEFVSPWVDDPAKQFEQLRPVLLSIGMTASASLVFAGTSYGCYFRTNAGASALSGQASPGLTRGQYAYTSVIIEYEAEVPSTTPVGLYVGDSLTEGRRSYGHPWPELHARRSGGIAVTNAHGGAATGNFDAPTDWQWTRYDYGQIDYDYAVVCIGSNNLNSGNSLAAIQAGILSMLATIRTVTGRPNLPLFVAAVPPRGLTGTNEETRVALNNWLRSLPQGVNGCFDFDMAVQSPTDVTVLDPRWVGDGTHPDLAGYKRMADTVGGRIIA